MTKVGCWVDFFALRVRSPALLLSLFGPQPRCLLTKWLFKKKKEKNRSLFFRGFGNKKQNKNKINKKLKIKKYLYYDYLWGAPILSNISLLLLT